jgi:hypothetical protein
MKPYTQAHLAIIALVVAGCTAIEKPSTPVNLRGPEEVKLSDGTELSIKNSGGGDATAEASAEGKRMSMSMGLSGAHSLKMKILETENGKIKEVEVSDAGGVMRARLNDNGKEKNETVENPVAGKVVTGVRSGRSWRWQEKNGGSLSDDAREFLGIMMDLMAGNSRELMPEKPVMAGYSWELKGSELESMINNLQVGEDDRVFSELREEADLTMSLKFKGIQELFGERCAHIVIAISGKGDVDGIPLTARGSGVFVRSLESGLVLQHKINLRFSASGTKTERGVRGTFRMSVNANKDTRVAMTKPEVKPDQANSEPEKPAEPKE